MQIGNPQYVYLLLPALIATVVMGGALARRHLRLKRFAGERLRKQVLPPGATRRRVISAGLLSAALLLLAVALWDLRWGQIQREVPQKGIEVVFALDVSRSMLAQDTAPNRLNRAKQQIRDMVSEMNGDRIGLVLFAGEARRLVPLTNHYQDFLNALETAGPHSVRTGGSKLKDALKAAADSFITKTNDHKAIVLFTDGEDQESQPVHAAQKIRDDQGVRIFTVGLGDNDQGARVPAADRHGYMQHDGQQVWSKLNGTILRQIATATGGAYIPAGTKQVDMASVYHRYVAQVKQTEFDTATINTYVARYQWFAAPALALLVLELLGSHWPRKSDKSTVPRPIRFPNKSAPVKTPGWSRIA